MMQYKESFKKVLESFWGNQNDQHCIAEMNSYYWSTLTDSILDLIHTKGDVESFLTKESDFINFGIIESMVKKPEDLRSRIIDTQDAYPNMKVQLVTQWLRDTINKTLQADREKLLKTELKHKEFEKKKIEQEIALVQEKRRELLLLELGKGPDKTLVSQIENLKNTDRLTLQNLAVKTDVSKGKFLSAQERQTLAGATVHLNKETAKNQILFSHIKSSEAKVNLQKYNKLIFDLLMKNCEVTKNIEHTINEMQSIESNKSSLSVLEIEEGLRKELDHLKSLVKLCAKRLHMESNAILKTEEGLFSCRTLYECLDRILDFDPNILHNDRIPIFGKPTVLLVPGNGQGLYDWKNNQLIVPLVAAGNDFIGSVATAALEYHLDADEDKKLLTSYQHLPQYKDVKSFLAVRSHFTKDYIKWMSSEFNGYKVLGKEVKKWFEQEIAPDKNSIYCPPAYQSFALNKEEYQALVRDVEERLLKNAAAQQTKDLWMASILHYQTGKFNESYAEINKLVTLDNNCAFAYFNGGIVCMKLSRKQEAIKYFAEFIKRNPQSWWANVASDHLRRLQNG